MIAQPPLPVPKAEAAIVRYFGPGTTIQKCRRFAPHLVGCDYSTPAINDGTEIEGGGLWASFVTVSSKGDHLLVRQ